jgi:hypothetical protein
VRSDHRFNMPLELGLFLGSALHRGQRNPPLPRLTRHAIPRKVRLDPAKAIMEWTGVMELRRLMSTFKVEGAGNLGD